MNSPINISCFGAIRPLKNHLSQALAAIQFANYLGRPLRFHINATRQEQQGQNILKNLRGLFMHQTEHQLVEHTWLQHADFLQLIKTQIDLGMQVSFTETYNIVAADHVVSGVPVVTSSEVRFVSSLYWADPNDIPSMVRTLYFAWKLRPYGVHQINRWLLNYQNWRARRIWRKNIDSLVD
jgi:hypothetical protein